MDIRRSSDIEKWWEGRKEAKRSRQKAQLIRSTLERGKGTGSRVKKEKGKKGESHRFRRKGGLGELQVATRKIGTPGRGLFPQRRRQVVKLMES